MSQQLADQSGREPAVNDDQPMACIYPTPLQFSLYCPHCVIFFRDTLAMDLHEFKVHRNVQNPFVCDHCEEVFETSNEFVSHMNQEHSSDAEVDSDSGDDDDNHLDNDCDISREVASRPQSVSSRRSSGAKERVFYCGQCMQPFATKQSYLIHSAAEHGMNVFRCERCDYATQKKSQLEQHSTTHSDERPFACDEVGCGKQFKSRRNLTDHKRKVHGSKSKVPLQCGKCPHVAADALEMRYHDRCAHNDHQVFRCVYEGCVYSAKKNGDLQKHIGRMHLKKKERRHVCDVSGCERRFASVMLLQQHKLSHENRFICRWKGCVFRCNTFARLNDHKRQEMHLKVQSLLLQSPEEEEEQRQQQPVVSNQ